MQKIKIKNFVLGEKETLTVICGPCVIENEEKALSSAEFLKKLFDSLKINFIYKSSYDKANRSSHLSFRGPGIEEGLRILEKIGKELDLPILTDIHAPEEAVAAAAVCEIIQIPAFLSRQTDLLIAAGKSGAIVNIKKGQFMAPWEMLPVIKKLESTNNKKIILTERGTSFGYNNLVADMRSIPILKEMGYPVCFDASHSIQLPGANRVESGGERQFIPPLSQAAIAAGADCLFIEAHPCPEEALSDRHSVYPFDQLEPLMHKLKQIYELLNH